MAASVRVNGPSALTRGAFMLMLITGSLVRDAHAGEAPAGAAGTGEMAGTTFDPVLDPESLKLSPRATFALSDQRFHDDPEVLFPGFLNGMRGFEHFYDPVGQPLYFETPFINTNVRILYIHHNFPKKGQIQGGDLHVAAAEARLALTDRLGFIATKDGYSWLNTGILPDDGGWNDISVGLKYALIADRENDLVLTTGFRWEWSNGDGEVLQGNSQELSPFIVCAKGFGDLHLMANANLRFPTSDNQGNRIASWDLHVDYDLSSIGLKGFAPIVELHGLHYLSDGGRLPVNFGGMDYDNFGSTDVAGSTVIWFGVGGRLKLTPQVSIGSTFELPLTNRNADILDNRVTVDITLTW